MTRLGRFFRSPWCMFTCCLLMLLSVGLLVQISIVWGTVVTTLPQEKYNRFRCDTVAFKEAGSYHLAHVTLRILELQFWSENLASLLCQDASIGQFYDQVEVSWENIEQFDVRDIYDQKFDVVVAKSEHMSRMKIVEDMDYAPIAQLANYSSFLVALDETPKLDSNYFQGKKLGLVDNPYNPSGYQIPKRAIKANQIDEALFETVFYKSHLDLYHALVAGEVDVIGSYIPIPPALGSLANPNLLLESNLPGTRWYLRRSLLDTLVHCRVAERISRYAKAKGSFPIETLSVTRVCSR